MKPHTEDLKPQEMRMLHALHFNPPGAEDLATILTQKPYMETMLECLAFTCRTDTARHTIYCRHSGTGVTVLRRTYGDLDYNDPDCEYISSSGSR